MVYSGFGHALNFDLDLISQGQITKLAISRLLSTLDWSCHEQLNNKGHANKG